MMTVVEWSRGLVAKWCNDLSRCTPKQFVSPTPIPHACGLRLLLGLALELGLSFSGTVLDVYTRRPLPYAAVAWAKSAAAYADDQGQFELTLPTDTGMIEVSHVGYRTRLVRLGTGRSITIYLTPEVINLRGVTVSAFRTPAAQSRSGPVWVLQDQMLKPQGRLSIADALALTPSLFTKDYANLATIGVRGANAEQTLILFDGVPLNSAQDNLADLVTLPLVLADRIEIVRGTNSALYGANSIGGLVNIMPPEPDSFSARITGGLGSLGQRYVQFLHTNRVDPFGYVLAGNLSRTGPRFAYRDTTGAVQERVNSDLADAGLMARGTYRQALSLLAEYNESRRGVPGPTWWPSDSARMNDSRAVIHLSYNLQMSDNARLETKAFYHRFWRHYWNPDTLSWVNDTHVTTASGLTLKQTTHVFDWATAVAGLEAGHDGLQSTAIGKPGRWTGSGWLEARLAAGEFEGGRWRHGWLAQVISWLRWLDARLAAARFEVTPMARLDLSSSSNPLDIQHSALSIQRSASTLVLSPKLALAGSPLPWLDLYASAGRSFRQPTFNELYWPEDPWTRGNPNLKPEWATSIDFSATGRLSSLLNCRLGAWYSHMTDLIEWQPDSNYVYQPVNLDTATITGVEAELGTGFRHAGITATGTYMLARSAGKDLIYRPRLTFGIQPWLSWNPVGLSANVRYVGPRYTVSDDTDSLPGFLLLDAGLTLSPHYGALKTTLRAGVRNILDRRYQVMKDYPVPGRTMYAEVELEY